MASSCGLASGAEWLGDLCTPFDQRPPGRRACEPVAVTSSPQPVELRPTAVAAGGDAIARDVNGRVVFVTGALPNELVRAEVVAEHRDYARARLVEVLDPSPD